jgi:hypothetical protein
VTARVQPTEGPPLWLVAPFFLVAPIGLIAAGLLLAASGESALIAINAPRTVAVTHALVIGWLTTTVMGATYQLGPAVVGGRLLSVRLARWQFGAHVLSVPVFIWAVLEWDTVWMSAAGALMTVSFVLYALNAVTSVVRGRGWSLPRAYLATSLAMLAATAGLGLTWVGALHHAWFPVTMGKLSAHAHVGLAGWLGLTLMGVSYQLVPMFNVVNRVKPRFGWVALPVTAAATAVFALVMYSDPPAAARVVIALFLAAGPAFWAADQVRFMALRSRRRLDVQGRATLTSVAFLALAAVFGVCAAVGTPFVTDDEPARWLLAYGACGIAGWLGVAVLGNSYKILPFLIWFHRYRPLVGRRPVPVLADLYSETAASVALVLLVAAASLLASAAAAGSLDAIRAGGLVLALAGLVHEGAILAMFLPRSASSRLATSAVVKAP